jgi:multidrug efflux pump subunit AcrA (membrane-fusion protein)
VVFAVRDGKAAEVTVTPGRKIGELTAITGEVKTGEKAVLKPASDLSAGMQVKAAGK